MHPDWLKLVTWLTTSNQNALFPSTIPINSTLIKKLYETGSRWQFVGKFYFQPIINVFAQLDNVSINYCKNVFYCRQDWYDWHKHYEWHDWIRQSLSNHFIVLDWKTSPFILSWSCSELLSKPPQNALASINQRSFVVDKLQLGTDWLYNYF